MLSLNWIGIKLVRGVSIFICFLSEPTTSTSLSFKSASLHHGFRGKQTIDCTSQDLYPGGPPPHGIYRAYLLYTFLYSTFHYNHSLCDWLWGQTMSITLQNKQNDMQCKSAFTWVISKCIKSCLNISSFDTTVVSCCRFDIFGFFGWCWTSRHMCSRGFYEFINFSFYATTKSRHAHQKIRLDKFVWKKWVSEIFMDTFIALSITPFENLLLWQPLFAGYSYNM